MDGQFRELAPLTGGRRLATRRLRTAVGSGLFLLLTEQRLRCLQTGQATHHME